MVQTSSVHIVRKYGPIGGMERYVWELTHALVKLGQEVSVICETTLDVSHPDIKVIQLGVFKEKPRWLSMLRFSKAVDKTVSKLSFPSQQCIIHSHERSGVHQVTSFHGPSILSRKRSIIDLLSPRLRTWEWLEARELCASNVRAVIPNSTIVHDQLAHFYPQAAARITHPMYPGVSTKFSATGARPEAKTIGFIGREWNRKGLDFACKAVGQLRKSDPQVRFVVAGCPPDEVKHLFRSWVGGYELLGWCEPEAFYRAIDLLILPSRNEPFGMVVAEANATNVPVLVSDQCGVASLIDEQQGMVLTLDDDAENLRKWSEACRRLLAWQHHIPSLNLSWTELARQHIVLYEQLCKPGNAPIA